MSEDNLTFSASESRAGTAPGVADVARRDRLVERSPQQYLPSLLSPPIAMTHACGQVSPSGDPIDLEIHGDLAAIEQEWKAFERSADCTVFQSFDFLAAWQRHIGASNGAVPAIILGRAGNGELLFILQFAIETRGMVRRLTWLGSDLCDYNAPLLDQRFSDHVDAQSFVALWQNVIKRLRADPRFRFDCVDLQKMPETIGAQENPFQHLQVLAHPSGAYVAHLGSDWNAFYTDKRSASTRKKERKQLKQLGEFGEVRFVDVQDVVDRSNTLETLLAQKSRSFAHMGVEDIFARPGYREFSAPSSPIRACRNSPM
jgi:CelD/BcsL family acetyltransferase involved in cellulose biosynthesis